MQVLDTYIICQKYFLGKVKFFYTLYLMMLVAHYDLIWRVSSSSPNATEEPSYSTLRVVARETEPQTLGSSQQDDQARPPNDVKSSNLIEDFTFFV